MDSGHSPRRKMEGTGRGESPPMRVAVEGGSRNKGKKGGGGGGGSPMLGHLTSSLFGAPEGLRNVHVLSHSRCVYVARKGTKRSLSHPGNGVGGRAVAPLPLRHHQKY